MAAELLVPLAVFRSELQRNEPLPDALSRLVHTFKVRALVILRRLLDADWIDRDGFEIAWEREVERLRDLVQGGSAGGDFYRTTPARVSRLLRPRACREHA